VGLNKSKPALLIVPVVVAAIAGIYWWSAAHNNSTQDDLAAAKLESVISIPPSEQRAGDAEKGRYHLLNSDYVNCGLPLRLFNALNPEVAAPDSDLTLAGRRGPAAQLPYYNNLIEDTSGRSIVTSNCLTCHAAPLFGEIVIGLGNEFLDFTEDASRQTERAGLLVKDTVESQIWRRLADKIAVVAPYTIASTVGVNIANNLTFALMAHRDPKTLSWSDDPVIEPPEHEALPVSVPPWWRMAKKNAMFYQGQARGDHARFMMSASLLCAENLQDVEKTDSYAADVRAYIASLTPPRYPFAINEEKSVAGRAVFQQHCLRCHGETESPTGYPNLLIPLAEIGTDAALAQQASADYQRFADWSRDSWFGRNTQFLPLDGYMPPPLDGVWATAPFLHNGSVPSIAALLDSKTRPKYWRHKPPRQFDKSAIGWSYQVLSSGKNPQLPHAENKWIYDTTQRGYANSGHTYGDVLSKVEREAVLEYLKTL